MGKQGIRDFVKVPTRTTSSVNTPGPYVEIAKLNPAITTPTPIARTIKSHAIFRTRSGRRPKSRAMKLVAATKSGSTK
jgi:hypothetical protein